MTSKVIELIKNGSILIPKLLLTNYKKLEITDKELILVVYLINNDEFDPERISNDLDLKIPDVLKMIDSLTKKDILEIKATTNKVYEEKVILDELYNKLALLIINKEEVKETTIYDKFEKEFARTLSPMEYEIIGAWIDNNYSEEIIEEALKEAIYNGVTSLKYIDKILSEWQRKGIKSKKDINKKPKVTKEKKEVFDYDWLNEND
ncbi:MAG: DnaD domain protein [Bacilli bacterium]|nr:DnaD domain protein [Bacilli bacterium]